MTTLLQWLYYYNDYIITMITLLQWLHYYWSLGLVSQLKKSDAHVFYCTFSLLAHRGGGENGYFTPVFLPKPKQYSRKAHCNIFFILLDHISHIKRLQSVQKLQYLTLQGVPKNALSECCWTHSVLAQSQVAGTPCVWKLIFWLFLTKNKPDEAFPSHFLDQI